MVKHWLWFPHQQIDGKAFLLLTQLDIVKIMSVKLGPALKIYNSILMFKHAEDQKQPPAGDTWSTDESTVSMHSYTFVPERLR